MFVGAEAFIWIAALQLTDFNCKINLMPKAKMRVEIKVTQTF